MSRVDRVKSAIKQEVSLFIQRELSDPRLAFVTITDIDLSKDLRFARLYYSVLGEISQKAAAQKALQSACGIIRHAIGQRIRLRLVPEITFKLDESAEYGIKIEKIFQDLKENEKKKRKRSK